MTGYYRYRNRLTPRQAGGLAVVALLMAGGVQGATHAAGRPVPAAAVSSSGNEALAGRMAVSGYGWGRRQRSCLDRLWTRESAFRTGAVNGQTGATGIPQLNPAYHQVPAGWSSPVTQIRWGLGYIRSTYGSPCSAWVHETADGWY